METRKQKKVADSRTTMTELVMPNDTNPTGNLMGGNLMRWMDIVASVCAARHCEAYVVTASVDHVSFQKPVHNGDVVTLIASVTRTFNTSLEVFVEVFTADFKGGNNRRSNHAYLTFVAIERDSMKPLPVPEILPLTGEEQKQFESAIRRRELRLVLSGRMQPKDATEIKNLFANL
jgi:acyl-CoA hydrolase